MFIILLKYILQHFAKTFNSLINFLNYRMSFITLFEMQQ